MADPRFFKVAGPFTLGQLAEIAGATLGEGCDAALSVRDVAPLNTAQADEVSFLDNRKYASALRESKAGAVIVHPEMLKHVPAGAAALLSQDPYRAYAKVARAFYPRPALEAGIATSATIAADAVLGEGCRVEPGAVIGAKAEIGRRCHIGPNVVIGDGVVLGDDCAVGANASISHAIIGSRTTIYAGARIGQDGFGFAMGPQGHLRVPQLGRVVIGNDVEVGANTAIDRGAGPDTVIGDGSMIDNLVQIGHNVQLGRGCVVVSQVGISGSTRLGDFVALGGQVGLAGHLTIGSGAQVGAQSGVMRDVAPGETVMGYPAMPARAFMRQFATICKLLKLEK